MFSADFAMHRAGFLGMDGSAIKQDLQNCSSPKDGSFPRPENMKEKPFLLPFFLQKKNKFGHKRNIEIFPGLLNSSLLVGI